MRKQSRLQGPFPLNNQTVQRIRNNCGVYELVMPMPHPSQQGYLPIFVGRSTNLQAKLQQLQQIQQIQSLLPDVYFYFRYTDCEQEAYEEECRIYHQHEPFWNDTHPVKALNSNWRCPICGQ